MSRLFYKALGEKVTWPTLPGNLTPTSITYADVNLIPQNTDISSRNYIDTTVTFGPYRLTIPFISAPMDTVVGERMIRALDRLGALGTLPRPAKGMEEDNLKITKKLTRDKVKCVYVVGLKTGLEDAQEYARL